MFSTQIFHHNHRIFPKDLKNLFVAKLFRSIGLQFSTFFMPLFLYQLGVKFHPFDISPFQNGMILLGMYFIFERISVFFFTIPTSKIIAKIGIRNSLIMSQVLYVIILALYVLAQHRPVYFLLILIIEGIRIPLFWCSYYSLFSSNALYKRMGESVGTLEFFTRLLQAAIPAISGLIIVQLSFSYIFYVSLFFQALSIVMLLLVKEQTKVSDPSLIELKVWLKEPQFRLLTFSQIGKYAADAMQGLWPLFVLILIGTADKVGYLYFVVFFVTLLLSYFAGWYVDHFKNRRPFAITGSILSSLWIMRFYITSIWSIMAVDIFGSLADSIYSPFYDSILLRRGKGQSSFSYFVYHEMIMGFSGIIFWGIFILYFVFTDSWRNFILLGFIAPLMSMQLRDKSVKIVEKE
ncbi:MAG: MFS transporter [Patescibacteria group bacterium]